MTEPPLPLIQEGQTRNFDLVLPEVPAFPGPGSEVDPSGSGGAPCQDELASLIASEDWIGLRMFIEDVTGLPIGDAVPEWALTAADGVTREATVDLCGVPTHLIITAEVVAVAGCQGLDNYILALDENDFTLPPIYVGADFYYDLYPSEKHDFQYVERGPSYEIHVDNPRLVYLPCDSGGSLAEPWNTTIGFEAAFSGVVESPVGSGNYYIPHLKITATVKHLPELHHSYTDFQFPDDPGDSYHTWQYVIRRAPIQFLLRRTNPSGGAFPTIDDAPRVGTSTEIAPGSFSLTNTDYPSEAWSGGGAAADGVWGMYPDALGEDVLWQGSPRYAYNPWYEIQTLSGTTSTWDPDSSDGAWESVVDGVADWQATVTEYDPEVAINNTDRSITVSYTTNENAMYIRLPQCATDSINDEHLQYNQVLVTAGSFYVFREHNSMIMTKHVWNTQVPWDSMRAVQVRNALGEE